ncbi:MAG: leucyl aminopeptidase [Candidatus Glassbacteria bacterium]|nr:leucyl aminopeptidase [Candidatus Glassbacteria bacterium]
MKVEIIKALDLKTRTDLLVLPVCEDRVMQGGPVLQLDKLLDGTLKQLVEEEDFKGKPGQGLTFHTMGKAGALRVALLGLGPEEKVAAERFRRLAGRAAEVARKYRVKSLTLACPVPAAPGLEVKQAVGAMAEGLSLGLYRFDKYKKEPEGRPPYTGPQKVSVIGFGADGRPYTDSGALKAAVERAEALAGGVKIARDLVNEIPEVMTPEELAKKAGELASATPGLKLRVLDSKAMARWKMNAALAVARGSDRKPCFIELGYAPRGAGRGPGLFLVGKGVTFDSGGLNIKPGEHMATMKMDMAGAAAVIAAITVVARMKLPVRVTALVAAVENLPGGRAYKPDDVVAALDGTTIEVGNTDAEGRVTLADSLGWAVKHKAGRIVDLATLTGSCVVGLGPHTAGALGNDEPWLDQVCRAAGEAGEKVALLPLDEDMEDDIKSEVADVKNVGATRFGGAITGALFLQKFVKDTPWVHLDIAGPAWADKKRDYAPVGGTGFGVRLLVHLVERLAQERQA